MEPIEQQGIPQDAKQIDRDRPDVDDGRSELVGNWIKLIEDAKLYWKDVFQGMRNDEKFASGKQWPGQTPDDDRYVANITLRHINQRVASIYAKNPRVRAILRPKKRSSDILDSPANASYQFCHQRPWNSRRWLPRSACLTASSPDQAGYGHSGPGCSSPTMAPGETPSSQEKYPWLTRISNSAAVNRSRSVRIRDIISEHRPRL